MNYFQKKVATVITTGALLVNSVLPVLAQSTDLVITGNGADSNSTVAVTQTSNTTVVQNNVADISNDVDASSNTGGNDQNYNTGGPVSMTTGDASTGVAVSNTANSNVANVEGCCEQDLSVEVSDNGYNTDNTAAVTLSNNTDVFQSNFADIRNDVDAKSNTGYNDQNYNTGGPVEMWTGDADTTVLIDNKANSNWAHVGDGGEGASVSLLITGNGADSDNTIALTLDRSLSVLQNNFADIENDVEAKSNTGKNDQNYNTGGPVGLLTGDATTGVAIDNMANFNFADLDCGCLLDVFAKIGGNGYNSDNTIAASLYDSKAAFQSNAYLCDAISVESLFNEHEDGCNDVEADSSTGKNDQKYNTGEGADPWTETGDAATLVDVENTANANVLTEGGSDLPELPEFDFDFDLGLNWLVWFGWLSGITG